MKPRQLVARFRCRMHSGFTCILNQTMAGNPINVAGFGRRVWAFLIDVLPIVLFTCGAYYLWFGFDETWQAYQDDPREPGARAKFLLQRNSIRNVTLLLWLVYCALLEASRWQGTIGKRLMGLRVTDAYGHRITLGKSVGRNAFKLISLAPLAIGFLRVGWSRDKRAWHDLVAGTIVLQDESDGPSTGRKAWPYQSPPPPQERPSADVKPAAQTAKPETQPAVASPPATVAKPSISPGDRSVAPSVDDTKAKRAAAKLKRSMMAAAVYFIVVSVLVLLGATCTLSAALLEASQTGTHAGGLVITVLVMAAAVLSLWAATIILAKKQNLAWVVTVAALLHLPLFPIGTIIAMYILVNYDAYRRTFCLSMPLAEPSTSVPAPPSDSQAKPQSDMETARDGTRCPHCKASVSQGARTCPKCAKRIST